MRTMVVWCTVFALVNAAGCRMFERFQTRRQPAPIIVQEPGSLADVLNTVARQTERVQQLRADVQVSTEGLPAAMRGDLMVERPDRLRLQAGVLGMSELGFDLGSNSEGFWIWKKASLPSDPPALYFARHEDYARSALAESTQLEPRWLLDALGFIEFQATARHVGPFPLPDGKVEVQTFFSTPVGEKVRVAVIDAQRGLLLRQTFYDQRGERIAYIDSRDHEYYRDYEVSLPRLVEVYVRGPEGGVTKLAVSISRFTINSLYGNPQQMWQMPNPSGVPLINLAGHEGSRAERPEVAAVPTNALPRDRYRPPY